MITLITGLPGNAKTLRAIILLREWSLRESRQVYYSGIKDLNLPPAVMANGVTAPAWVEIDPKKWNECPDGSIIFIDEAQLTFPKKPNGSELPGYYQDLTTHRHHGFDIVLATQHPSLVDNFIRKLCQRHLHAIRKFGMERSTYWEWDKVSDNPELPRAQKLAIGSTQFVYPKAAFKWYTSAAVHTVKRKIPTKLILAVLLVVVVGCYAFYTINHMVNRKNVPDTVAASVGVIGSASVASSSFDPVADARHFINQATPRIVGLPQTAPKYDELTKPSRVPVPAACIQYQGGDKCKCFTQQGTSMGVAYNMCVEFARNGFFQEFDADKDKVAAAVTVRGAEVIKNSPVGVESYPSQVLTFGSDIAPARPAAASAGPSGSGGRGKGLPPVGSSLAAADAPGRL